MFLANDLRCLNGGRSSWIIPLRNCLLPEEALAAAATTARWSWPSAGLVPNSSSGTRSEAKRRPSGSCSVYFTGLAENTERWSCKYNNCFIKTSPHIRHCQSQNGFPHVRCEHQKILLTQAWLHLRRARRFFWPSHEQQPIQSCCQPYSLELDPPPQYTIYIYILGNFEWRLYCIQKSLYIFPHPSGTVLSPIYPSCHHSEPAYSIGTIATPPIWSHHALAKVNGAFHLR